MKAATMLILFIFVAVNAQKIQVFAPTSCEYQLVEPLNALLYDDYQTWTEVCNGSQPFFYNCRDDMLLTCKIGPYVNACSIYMYWIDAFVAGGKRFACAFGYENITDISKNQGGHSCTYNEVNNDLTSSVDDIRTFLKSPKDIACNDVTRYMNATLTVLNGCDNASMMNLVQDFFEQVLDFSPCPNSPIGAGAEQTVVANTMFLIGVAIFHLAILSFS